MEWPWKMGPLPDIPSLYCSSVLAKPITQCMAWCLEAQESSAWTMESPALPYMTQTSGVPRNQEHEDGEDEAGMVPSLTSPQEGCCGCGHRHSSALVIPPGLTIQVLS